MACRQSAGSPSRLQECHFPPAVVFAPFANWPCVSKEWHKWYQGEAVWVAVFSGGCVEPPCPCAGCAVRVAQRIPRGTKKEPSKLSELSLDFSSSVDFRDEDAEAVAVQLPGTLAQLSLDFSFHSVGDGLSVGNRRICSFSSALRRTLLGIAGFVLALPDTHKPIYTHKPAVRCH